MKFNPHKHHRRSIRLQGYDYSRDGLYFITICCQDRAHLFGEVQNKEMLLNPFGEIALQEWLNTNAVRNNVVVHELVVMPNHLHGIVEITHKKGEDEIGSFQSPSHTIGAIVRGYKIATIKKIKDSIEGSKGDSKGDSKGELQFAPTAPTAPTASTASTVGKIISLNYKIWQRNYYEHIIRDHQEYHRISEYIKDNPAKWEEDKFYKKKISSLE